MQGRFPNALKLQCVPQDAVLWDTDRYEDFLFERRRLLADELNTFLEGITETASAVPAANIDDLISEGESDSLEFKSSLRWDCRQGIVNKALELVVAKAVSAFANADGGILLIGVDDDGTVIGLDNDYASLSGDRDRFEVHLRNLLNQQFGESFVASKLTVSFHAVEESEICQVEISRVDNPLVVRQKDKSGQTVEKLFVRSGNSSQEVPLSEAQSYFATRFS